MEFIPHLKGRRALVTGGASGIGEACVRALARAGAEVTVADIDVEAAEALAADVKCDIWGIDLGETGALEELQLETDILINNAGIQHVSPIQEFEPECWRLIQRLMLEAPFLLTRAALPGMYNDGFGRIINISSIHGVRASPYKSAYVAAKHGLEGFSKVIALEGARHGVTSNCVSPGYVRTPLVDRQVAELANAHDIPEAEVLDTVLLTEPAVKQLIEPEEVASLVLWLSSDAAKMATGASYLLDGGWSSH